MIFDHPRIVALFSRKPQNMSLCYGDTSLSLSNRQAFLSGLQIDQRRLVCARQVHGASVVEVTQDDAGKGASSQEAACADTDALITRQKELPLAIFTADCLCVFLYDPRACAIGLVHAGWRGTQRKITPRTVELMRARYATDPADLLVGFGPLIRQCCYEVGSEFRQLFPGFTRQEKDATYLDLAGINKAQLCGLGVSPAHIQDSCICTSCRSDEYFSYRKEGNSAGRMMSVLMIKKEGR